MVTNQKKITLPKSHTRQRLDQWFNTELGSGLLSLERAYLDQALNNLFGYHLLQVGNLNNVNLLSSSRISHKIIMDFYQEQVHGESNKLICDSKSIAIESDSMDVVVLPHVLEFESSPHQLLRETERILIGEGHVVIIAFNPWSLWGLWRLFLAWRDEPPWCGQFLSMSRLNDWLKLLDFETVKTEHFYFRPPFKSRGLMKHLQFFEKLGRFGWSFFGGVYLVVAKKRVVPLTPVKMRWHQRRRMIASGAIEPSARLNDSMNKPTEI